MIDRESEPLNRLERKLDLLIGGVAIQTVLIAMIAASYLMQIAQFFTVLLIIALPILFLARRSLPSWARRAGSLVGHLDRLFRQKLRDRPTSPKT